MPTNFESIDPGIIDRPYVQQIPLDALFKNMAFGQQEYDQNLQAAKHSVDTLRNITTFGHDTQIKNELFSKLDEELAKFDGADFRDPNVQMQIEGLVGEFTKTKDVAGMHARGVTFEKMQKEAEAARLKGEEYYNPGYDEAMQYYNTGTYRTDARFRDEGNIAPDFEKLRESILKMPQVTYKKTETGPNGDIISYDVVNPEKAAQAYRESLERDPKLSKYIKYKFEAQHPGVDWTVEGKNHFGQQANHYLELSEQERLAATLATDPKEKATHLLLAEEAEKQMGAYKDIYDKADKSTGDDLKGLWFDEYKSQEAERFGRTKALLTPTKIEKDAAYLENLTHSNAMKKLERENFYDRGIDPTTGKPLVYSQDVKDMHSGSIASASTAEDFAKWNSFNEALNQMRTLSTQSKGEALIKTYVAQYDPAIREAVKYHTIDRVILLTDGNLKVSFVPTKTNPKAPITISPRGVATSFSSAVKYQQAVANAKLDIETVDLKIAPGAKQPAGTPKTPTLGKGSLNKK